MALNRLRRNLLVAACASVGLLTACGGGGGDVVSQFSPTRVVVFGDGFADLGQRGARYTVNDGSVNVWTEQLAARYRVPVSSAASGGLSYATGNARVTARPDAAGNASTPTVREQVDAFLAAHTLGGGDLVIVSAGTADVLAEVARQNAGAQNAQQTLANLGQAGRELSAQVRRLVQAGAQHVLVVGTYNLGRSPWATATSQGNLLLEASQRFNEELLVSMVDLGGNVLYVDAGLYFNLVTAGPTGYGFTDATTAVCNSVDPGPGIGIGAGQVNSALCTPATLKAGLDPARYVFADPIYFTPAAQRLFGDYAYDRIRARW